MNRLLYVDVQKGLLILFVVLGHAIQFVLGPDCFDNRLWNIIYSFHMPCFIAISGYFAPKEIQGLSELGRFLWRRFQQLMIPMLIWQMLYIFAPPSQTINLLSIIDCGSFWFLWALFFISFLYAVVVYATGKLHLPSIVFHAIATSCLIGFMVLKNYHQHGVQYIAYYYPFFVMGYYLKKHNACKVDLRWFWLVSLLWLAGSLYWRMHDVPSILQGITFIPSSILTYCYRYAVGFMAVFAFYGISAFYLNKEYKWTTAFARLGIYSLGIYTIHIFLLKILKLYIDTAFILSHLLFIVGLFVFLTTVSVLIIYCFSKNKLTSRLFLGKLK